MIHTSRPIRFCLFSALICFAVAGCQPANRTFGGAPATPQRLEELRSAYQAQRPGTIVGAIIAVMPENNLAAIGDVPADRFAEGDLISIIDSRENTLAMARVVRRIEESNSVHVRYTPNPNSRAVMEGDVAVRLPDAGAPR